MSGTSKNVPGEPAVQELERLADVAVELVSLVWCSGCKKNVASLQSMIESRLRAGHAVSRRTRFVSATMAAQVATAVVPAVGVIKGG